ncbi:MAG: hypothetical protein HAW66_06600 [Shewanella sp.]|nr:hypothetical protein [Shewanella sp.]
MNNDIKGMCLFLGFIGLGYVLFLMLIVAFTGVKIVKSILLISMLSSLLVSVGLTSTVKNRILVFVKSAFIAGK